tara:strand:+ start:3229 stop:5328 length:2100 start_codon:yes stop_codon:yes gene_type:complete
MNRANMMENPKECEDLGQDCKYDPCDCAPSECGQDKPETEEALGRISEALDLKIPDHMMAALKAGLEWYGLGYAGRGISPATVEAARQGLETGEWSGAKWRKASAWFARNARHIKPETFEGDKPAPTAVSFALWGATGDGAAIDYAKTKADQIKQIELARELTEREEGHLAALADQHNEAWAGEPSKTLGTGALREAWQRGGALRASALLHLVRTGRPFHGEAALDLDLVPEGNPAHDLTRAEATEDGIILGAQELSENELMEGALHVLRVGPIYDIETGDLVLDVTEELAEQVAQGSQALLDAGQVIPISLEHGIESAQRGDKGDHRPYGSALKVWYDKKKKGVYAAKEWTALGLSLVAASQTPTGSALRISPRIKVRPVYHPQTGEEMAKAFADVISITTLPRQDSVGPVALNRSNNDGSSGLYKKRSASDKILTTGRTCEPSQEIDTTEQAAKAALGATMAEEKATQAEEIILGRGTKEASAVLDALGLGNDAPAVELARAAEEMKTRLDEATAELNRYQEKEAATALQLREQSANDLLDRYEVADVEREFFFASLMADDAERVEMARKVLETRGATPKTVKVGEAIEAAKERGAVPADFTIEGDDLIEAADVVVEVLSRIPGGTVIPVGEPAGSSTAGLEGHKEMDKEAAGRELSELARKYLKEGTVETLIEGHALARQNNPEIERAAFARNEVN